MKLFSKINKTTFGVVVALYSCIFLFIAIAPGIAEKTIAAPAVPPALAGPAGLSMHHARRLVYSSHEPPQIAHRHSGF
jgi:hypothetical protein